MSLNVGKIIKAQGPVVDVQFAADKDLPDLNTAIKIDNHGEELTVEVAQHIGDDIVRCIAMGPTDGLTRGMDAVDTNAPISVPVGNKTLGRMFNVLGHSIDGKDELTEENICQFIDQHLHLLIREQKLKFLKQVLKSLT